MLKKWYWLCLIILIVPTSIALGFASIGSSSMGDPYYPELGNGGYDAQHYLIDLNVDMDANTIAGTSTLEAVATEDLSQFNLDFLGLEISDITVNGAEASFTRTEHELTITPVDNLANPRPP